MLVHNGSLVYRQAGRSCTNKYGGRQWVGCVLYLKAVTYTVYPRLSIMWQSSVSLDLRYQQYMYSV